MAGKQFAKLDCSRGAPMGRAHYGIIENQQPRTIRLFKVNLDSGAYDDGGAYWGHGKPIYCAVSDDATYRQFVRAHSRAEAKGLLGIPRNLLKNPI